MDWDKILDDELLRIHQMIDDSAKAKWRKIEWWHIYRTTGMMIIYMY